MKESIPSLSPYSLSPLLVVGLWVHVCPLGQDESRTGVGLTRGWEPKKPRDKY